MKLFMVLTGCTPKGRNVEQHDVFFGIGENLRDLIPAIIQSWPGSGKIHIDAWREVNFVDNFKVEIIPRQAYKEGETDLNKLFFINLGGYRQNEFDEFHYKMLAAGENKAAAIQQSKATAFY